MRSKRFGIFVQMPHKHSKAVTVKEVNYLYKTIMKNKPKYLWIASAKIFQALVL